MKTKTDVIIIGGGLAGLSAAIHLSKQGLQVTLIEKSAYPRHKVCGEYISNEIVPYLSWLGININQLHPTTISKFEFSTQNSKIVNTRLPLGGFGISRYKLEHFLYQKAIRNGCTVIIENVVNVTFSKNVFTVTTPTQTLYSETVLGAFGKRSNIDQQLSRNFIKKKTPWLAVKGHYSGNFDADIVALHNFNGGYCGISKIENGILNICYLADYQTFKKYKNIDHYQQSVLFQNRHLKSVFEKSTLLFDKPITISQISFDRKQTVENHIIMIGDTAGLIHPLCGNGMAMAIHSAKIASELVLDFHSGLISRKQLEKNYKKKWKQNFGKRLFIGRLLGKIFIHKKISNALLKLIIAFPKLLPLIIRQTHGKPIAI
ncbi:NAD(P)/FAD-dependent oxidoreductase [Flavobacterium sp. ARAG 55.4]|uniref:NAD(P)/FAD-dependent oxidoreductase n=1 Tax=Flavobacterium sp. ARAG 55.4 TaxID=3451357 RepID=UPI003F4628E2